VLVLLGSLQIVDCFHKNVLRTFKGTRTLYNGAYSSGELESKSRVELQQLAKEHGIKGNLKSAELLEKLRAISSSSVRSEPVEYTSGTVESVLQEQGLSMGDLLSSQQRIMKVTSDSSHKAQNFQEINLNHEIGAFGAAAGNKMYGSKTVVAGRLVDTRIRETNDNRFPLKRSTIKHQRQAAERFENDLNNIPHKSKIQIYADLLNEYCATLPVHSFNMTATVNPRYLPKTPEERAILTPKQIAKQEISAELKRQYQVMKSQRVRDQAAAAALELEVESNIHPEGRSYRNASAVDTAGVTVNLDNVSLQDMVIYLTQTLGYKEMFKQTNIRAFRTHPSIQSSLKALRKPNMEWGREKITSLYVAEVTRRATNGAHVSDTPQHSDISSSSSS
jgi:hypothetical protein